MSAYRQPAVMPVEEPKPAPAGRLVRSHGCNCTPPGVLWCWWHRVDSNDEWICEHGKVWSRGDLNTMWHRRQRSENERAIGEERRT